MPLATTLIVVDVPLAMVLFCGCCVITGFGVGVAVALPLLVPLQYASVKEVNV